jgi:asparagine synthase (glutamine-hydrolysing)
VIHRSKTGFGAPVRQWVKEDAAFQKMAQERLFEGALQQVFDTSAIARLWQDTTAGRYDGSYTILSLMAVESWLRQFAK